MVKQERARRTREKVLDAAAEEFAVHGYTKTTLNAVAERTGMSKGALYGHFASKRGLASTLLHQSREAWEDMRLAREAPGVAAATVLEGLVLDLAHHLRADIRLRAALRLAGDCPRLARSGPGVFEEVRQALVVLTRRAQGEGGMAPHSPEVVAQLLLILVHGALHVSYRPDASGGAPQWEDAWRLLLAALSIGEGAGADGEGGPRVDERRFSGA